MTISLLVIILGLNSSFHSRAYTTNLLSPFNSFKSLFRSPKVADLSLHFSTMGYWPSESGFRMMYLYFCRMLRSWNCLEIWRSLNGLGAFWLEIKGAGDFKISVWDLIIIELPNSLEFLPVNVSLPFSLGLGLCVKVSLPFSN